MRLYESITPTEWEQLRSELEKNCMPYIKMLKGCKSLLRRGAKTDISFFEKKTQRQDRRPLLINKELHTMMDTWSKKNWGFAARSASSFTTNREHNARMYGKPYIFFPIGNLKYAWNDDVTELYKTYDGWIWRVSDEYNSTNYHSTSQAEEISEEQAQENVFNNLIVPELQNYKTSGLDKMLKQPGDRQGYAEAIINCKSYYLINAEWRETLTAWYGDRYWRKK